MEKMNNRLNQTVGILPMADYLSKDEMGESMGDCSAQQIKNGFKPGGNIERTTEADYA